VSKAYFVVPLLLLAARPVYGQAINPRDESHCLGADTLPRDGWMCSLNYGREMSATRAVPGHPSWRIFDERWMGWGGENHAVHQWYYDGYVVDCTTRRYGWLGSSAAEKQIPLTFYEARGNADSWVYDPGSKEVRYACSH
jgi:hypothetical protein